MTRPVEAILYWHSQETPMQHTIKAVYGELRYPRYSATVSRIQMIPATSNAPKNPRSARDILVK